MSAMDSNDSNKNNNKHVEYSLKKLGEALADYNLEEAKGYLEMAQMWLRKK